MDRKGFTLVEVLIVMAILSIAVLSVVQLTYVLGTQTVSISDRAFATQKAMQMMEELRTLVARSNDTNVGVLDDYDDGAIYNKILTTDKTVTAPNNALSGNKPMKSGWRFLRQVNVISMPNEPLARRVYIKVYKSSEADPNKPEKSLSEMVSVIKATKASYPPNEVMDVYVLAIENVPGWWAAMSTMKPMFDNVIQDLQSRNPGLELRVHWITRLGYGRDLCYTPYINSLTYTSDVPMPYVYFYPGLMKNASNQDFLYYDPDNFFCRVNVDGEIKNSDSYSLADQYNNCVRYPEEERLYGVYNPPEISLRMLLELMNTNPAMFKNILFVNLHGELLPLPPMRNYSDPAKDHADRPRMRVVVHPQQMKYNAGDDIYLRVYAYAVNPDTVATNTTVDTITIFFPYANINSSSFTISKLEGNDTVAYQWITGGGSSLGYSIDTPPAGFSNGTCITLSNTPARHPQNGNTGLNSTQRLYGLEYIPCPIQSGAAAFNKDLTWNNNNDPKNTARWLIKISSTALSNGMYTYETRMGADLTTGTLANKPANLSKNYFWLGVTPPVTEQYQFMGDPRYMPYTDIKANDGYNWYFVNINLQPNGYEGYTNSAGTGWNGNGGLLNIDVPRYFQIYRQGLLSCGGIWTNMTGFSFYYVGIGNEMGADSANGFPSGLPICDRPWVPTGSGQAKVDEITSNDYGTGTQRYARLIAKTDNSWVCMPWIGDIYPGDHYTDWAANGNLLTGAGNFYRVLYSTFFNFDPVKRTCERGCASFFNGKPSSGNGPFCHEYEDGKTGTITTVGLTLAQIFNLPLMSSIQASRPFTLNYNSRTPPEWANSVYNSQRTSLSTLKTYYDSSYSSSSYDASAQVSVTNKDGTQVCYGIMNGIDKQTNFGSAQIAKLTVVSMIRGFMDGGNPGISVGRISQLPKVTLTKPGITDEFKDPGTPVNVAWTLEWKRWDGQKYTEDYPDGYTESTVVSYNVKYSNDMGKHWYFIQDGTAASAGSFDQGHSLAGLSCAWSVSGLPRGTYLLRAEAYRQNYPLHYSYHQMQVYLDFPGI